MSKKLFEDWKARKSVATQPCVPWEFNWHHTLYGGFLITNFGHHLCYHYRL